MKNKFTLHLNLLLSISILFALLFFPSSIVVKASDDNPPQAILHEQNTLTRIVSNDPLEPEFELQASTVLTATQTMTPPNGYKRPIIVVNTYSMSQDTISPGDTFTLFIKLYNAGQQYAMNIRANFTQVT